MKKQTANTEHSTTPRRSSMFFFSVPPGPKQLSAYALSPYLPRGLYFHKRGQSGGCKRYPHPAGNQPKQQWMLPSDSCLGPTPEQNFSPI
jgi:hypothetical protein